MNNYLPFNKPNLFILGAAKSGTTSLFNYLKPHPNIFLSNIKEPSFFCEDFQVIKNPIKYFELFDNATNEIYLGEASHVYLTDPKVARILKSLFPDSKFILILRNPAERAYSLYNHMRRHRYESLNTFEKALRAEEKRKESIWFKNNNPQYFYNFLYFESGKYGSQINRYLSLFDKSQFLFIKYEEFIHNRTEGLNKIWEFLGIPEFTCSHDIHSNKGFAIRYHLLEKLIRSKFIANKVSVKLGIKRTLKSINNIPIEPLRNKTKAKLMDKYNEDLELLYNLTGIEYK